MVFFGIIPPNADVLILILLLNPLIMLNPRAVASGCYNQIYRTIRPLRTMRVASVATARGSAISTDLREELELAGKHLVE